MKFVTAYCFRIRTEKRPSLRLERWSCFFVLRSGSAGICFQYDVQCQIQHDRIRAIARIIAGLFMDLTQLVLQRVLVQIQLARSIGERTVALEVDGQNIAPFADFCRACAPKDLGEIVLLDLRVHAGEQKFNGEIVVKGEAGVVAARIAGGKLRIAIVDADLAKIIHGRAESGDRKAWNTKNYEAPSSFR